MAKKKVKNPCDNRISVFNERDNRRFKAAQIQFIGSLLGFTKSTTTNTDVR
jgi:hypothetical protein